MDQATKLTVVIVDDSVAQLHELARICEDLDALVIGKAMNGADAVREVKTKRPNLVLMDLMMPDIDGFIALRMLTKGIPGTRVAIVSSLVTNIERARECQRQGAVAVFSKPVDVDQMKELFEQERERLSQDTGTETTSSPAESR